MVEKATVEFVKIFKSGILKEIPISGKLTFPSFGGAENWIGTVRWKMDHGQTDFVLDSARIIEGEKVVYEWSNN